jgi:serine/threonine protein kinase
MRYSDHGEHQLKNDYHHAGTSIIRKITFEAKDRFQRWEHDEAARRAATASSSGSGDHQLSPHRFAFSQLALEETDGRSRRGSMEDVSMGETTAWTSQRGKAGASISIGKGPTSDNKGLLSAVLEGHSDSATSASGVPGVESRASTASQSISTKDSRTAASSLGPSSVLSGTSAHPHRGQCLTSPSDAVANDGQDNAEGNLIVYENDLIVVPRKNIHTVRQVKKEDGSLRSAEFRIQGLQGQGTFAQVFQCLHVQTGQQVALKIVKNKPAYTRQAAMEIEIFETLQNDEDDDKAPAGTPRSRDYMVNLLFYFKHQNHLCIVFELLGLNLYEVLKRRQFRGLPLTMVRDIVQQVVHGIKDLSQKNIVHADLKPENLLLVSEAVNKHVISASDSRRRERTGGSTAGAEASPAVSPRTATASKRTSFSSNSGGAKTEAANVPETSLRKVKLIDFGSACFEGHTSHTYIQSRFYRSPEVLIGLPYDSAIDMWSLGCVAAELFLGLPILPGVHEHDQVGRILEMIGKIPDWMLDQGAKSSKYYVKFVPRPRSAETQTRTPSPGNVNIGTPALALPQWRVKTHEEYINSLSEAEVRKKGGLGKLRKQPGNRYFKRKRLADILFLHAQNSTGEDRRLVPAFVHFLHGVLDPDPWKRLSAFQAAQHPFVTGDLMKLRAKDSDMILNTKDENLANLDLDFYWQIPWDPAICKRKLLNVQKIREKQAARRGLSGRSHAESPSFSSGRRRSRMGESTPTSLLAESFRHVRQQGGTSPPTIISSSASTNASHMSQQIQMPATTPTHIAASWTGLGQPVGSSQLAPASVSRENAILQSVPSAPQSFTGMSYGAVRTPSQADFAYALQRPGVFPGGYALGTSASSQSTAPSFHQAGVQSIQYGAYTGTSADMPFSLQSSASERSVSGGINPQGVGVSSSNQWSMLSPQNLPESNFPAVSTTGQPYHQYGEPLPSNGQMMTNAAGFPPSGATTADPRQLAMLQQLQQQQINSHEHPAQLQFQQLQLPWNQQLIGQAMAQPPQFAMLPQQPQIAFPQQQPVYLAAAPGGGYYYVTTTATGQPIILQPVGVLDQTVNQAGLAYITPNQAYISQPSSQQTMSPNSGPGNPGVVNMNPSRQQPRSRRGHFRGGTSM